MLRIAQLLILVAADEILDLDKLAVMFKMLTGREAMPV